MRRAKSKQGRVAAQRQRRQYPDRHENDLALQIVTDFYFLLVFVGGVIHHVVVSRFKEEMPDLAAGHRGEPTDQGRNRGVLENHDVCKQKTHRTHQMERLVDPAVMIVAMVVPTLHSQSLKKTVHCASPC